VGDFVEHFSEPFQPDVFELDLLVSQGLVEPGRLDVKFLLQLLNKGLRIFVVNVVKLRVDEPVLMVLFDELLNRGELLFDRIIKVDNRLKILLVPLGLVPLGGADELDQENFHHDSRDDNYLDVSKIL